MGYNNTIHLRCLIAIVSLWVIMGICTTASAQAPDEVRKIEYLISSLEKMKDAEFIRNGTAYNSKQAAEHLRLKWKKGGTGIKTADDFIKLCATRSYITGQTYKIRFANGRMEDAATVLRRMLKEVS